MGIGGSVGGGFGAVVSVGFGFNDGITFSLDDLYDLGSSSGFFGGSNEGKPVGTFLDE